MENLNYENTSQNQETAQNGVADRMAEKVESSFQAGKQRLANVMESSSDSVVSGVSTIEDKALMAAEKLADGAKYLRTKSGKDIVQDCKVLVEKYPYHAMGMAALAGIFLGRSVMARRSA